MSDFLRVGDVRARIVEASYNFEQSVQDWTPSIRLEFSNRMTRAMGYAKYRSPPYSRTSPTYQITLSAPLFMRADTQERENTIIHEYCHLLDKFLYGSMDQHGPNWQNLMKKLGFEPTRCHNVNIEGLRTEYFRNCPCGARLRFGPTIYRKMKAGQIRGCGRCRKTFTIQDVLA